MSERTATSTGRTLTDAEKLAFLQEEYNLMRQQRDQAREERDHWRRLCQQAERKTRGYDVDDSELRSAP